MLLHVATVLILVSVPNISGVPFLYNAPQTIADLASAASASASSSASSQRVMNIADLRQNKLSKLTQEEVDDLDNDDFFKEPVEVEVKSGKQEQTQETDSNEAAPSFLQKKISKILRKLSYISRFANSGSGSGPSSSDDDFQKELDDFDKELQEDNDSKKNSTTQVKIQPQRAGYFYDKPVKIEENAKKSEKQTVQSATNSVRFNPANIGVFFMELIGSLVGLAYGAAAQLNYPTTTQVPNLFRN